MPEKYHDPEVNREEASRTDVHESYPEGGWRAWGAVLGVWLIQFCTFGYTNAFGVYQDYYVREYLTHYTSSEISWIGSVQTMALFALGYFSGNAFDRGYFYHLTIGGTILFIFCLFMLSLSHTQGYYQVFLCQGLGIGLAFGAMYIPSLGLVGHYFKRRRALAMGIAASGSSVGGIIHPIMLNHLFYGSVGFHVGVRASAGFILGLMAIAILLARPRLPPKKEGTITSQLWTFCRDPPYMFATSGAFLLLCGFLFPFFFLQLDAISRGVDSNLAFSTLAILSGASTVGRVLGGILATSIGVFNIMIASSTIASTLIFCLLAVRNAAGFISFSVLFGLSSGAYISLLAPMLAMLSRDITEIGARMGFCFTLLGIAALISSPIGGSLLSKQFIWWRPIIFSGVTMAAGVFLFVIARYLLWKRRSQSNPPKFSQII